MKLKDKPYYLFLLALLSGFFLWLGWPTKPTGYILHFAFVPLLLIEHHLSQSSAKRKAWKFFSYAYLSLVIWNVLTTYWIYNAAPGAGIFAMTCNALLMCIPMMMFFHAKRLTNTFIGLSSLVVYWITFEYIHLNWKLTWPWLTLGNAFSSTPMFVQWYEYTGALGGTLWILVSNVAIFYFIKQKDSSEFVKYKSKTAIAILLWILIPTIISFVQYNNTQDIGKDVEVVVVQPNIDPYEEKFAGSDRFIPFDEQLNRLINLSEKAITPNTRYVAWPETALPFGYNEKEILTYDVIKRLQEFANAHPNISLITGLDSYKIYQTQATSSAVKHHEDEFVDAFNTAMQINNQQSITLYHKSRLVPGVEYMPPLLSSFAIAMGESAGGLGRQETRTVFFNQDSMGVAPVICYESIFGEFVSEYVKNGANMIFIITNDGWWGNTQGHKQHLQYATLRSIETRKSIARSANTGISGFINQRGDILERSKYWEQKVMRMNIKENNIQTFYTKHGDYIGTFSWVIALAFFILALIAGIKSVKKEISQQ